MLNPDEVLRPLKIAGANRVYCSSKMDIFGFDDLRPGPTDSTALVRVSYVDEPQIRKACKSAARPSKDVTPELKKGQALIADTSLRNEYFIVDLRKRGQLVSQRSGKSFDFNWSDAP